ncbi:protein kinase [Candidatus Woesearchaeota archaeon]|nr:protein kinase [Candidatus Woesearchaeota archaeon]
MGDSPQPEEKRPDSEKPDVPKGVESTPPTTFSIEEEIIPLSSSEIKRMTPPEGSAKEHESSKLPEVPPGVEFTLEEITLDSDKPGDVTVKLSGKPIEDNRGGATFATDLTRLEMPRKNAFGQIEGYTRVDGRYEFIKRIGGGGFGDVYLARDRSVDRDVAIKVCKPGPDYELTFKREIEILKQAEVTGIVRMYDVTKVRVKRMTEDLSHVLADELCEAYVMEFIPGMPLSSAIRKYFSGDPDMRAAWSQARFLQEFTELCKAVQFLHKSGVIHRDLKPDNVYVSDRNEIKLLDLGLAKTVKELAIAVPEPSTKRIKYDDSLNSIQGGIAGTLSYMSPEQVDPTRLEEKPLDERSGVKVRPLDERSDIYALGAVLYTMMCGEAPWYKMPPDERHEMNSLEYWQALICRGEIVSVNTLINEHNTKIQAEFAEADEKVREEARKLELKEVDPVLELIIMSALRRDIKQRYQNVGEMLVDINDYFDGNFNDIQSRTEKRLLDEKTQVYGRRDAAPVMESEIAALTEKIREAEGKKKYALAAQLRIDAATKCLELGKEYKTLNEAGRAVQVYSQCQEFLTIVDQFSEQFVIDVKRTKNRAQHGKAIAVAAQKNYDEAIHLARDALAGAEELGDIDRKVNMLAHIAGWHVDKAKLGCIDALPIAKEYALKALDLAVEIDYESGISDGMGILTAYATVANDFDMMHEILGKKEFWITKLASDPRKDAHLQRRFADIYSALGDESLALEHGQLALKLGEQVQDEGVVFAVSKLLGTFFCEKGDPEQAIPYLRRAYSSNPMRAILAQQEIMELCKKYGISVDKLSVS